MVPAGEGEGNMFAGVRQNPAGAGGNRTEKSVPCRSSFMYRQTFPSERCIICQNIQHTQTQKNDQHCVISCLSAVKRKGHYGKPAAGAITYPHNIRLTEVCQVTCLK